MLLGERSVNKNWNCLSSEFTAADQTSNFNHNFNNGTSTENTNTTNKEFNNHFCNNHTTSTHIVPKSIILNESRKPVPNETSKSKCVKVTKSAASYINSMFNNIETEPQTSLNQPSLQFGFLDLTEKDPFNYTIKDEYPFGNETTDFKDEISLVKAIKSDDITLIEFILRILLGDRSLTFYNYINTYYFSGEYFNKSLNVDQKRIVENCLLANKLFQIYGPPGTGKTSTLTEIVCQLLANNQKVIVASASNIAVDTLAERILKQISSIKEHFSENTFTAIRIGNPVKIIKEVQEILVDSIIEKRSSIKKQMNDLRKFRLCHLKEKQTLEAAVLKCRIEELLKERRCHKLDLIKKAKLIFITLTSSDDEELNSIIGDHNKFDVLVIDEAAQAKVSECLLPIHLAEKLILAGDHKQLPTVVRGGIENFEMSISLFEKIYYTYGSVLTGTLFTQYRMNKLIMRFSSENFYRNSLKASIQVSNHNLKGLIQNRKNFNIDNFHDVLGLLTNSLVFCNTQDKGYHEVREKFGSRSYKNPIEALLVKKIVDYLLEAKVQCDEIGIITPYAAQVNLLFNVFTDLQEDESSSFKLKRDEKYKDLELNTVDGFQGREKEIIIISMTRSQDYHRKVKKVGFLSDERRMNVAITRARRLLVVIGDYQTVSTNMFLRNMCNYLKSEGKVITHMLNDSAVINYLSKCKSSLVTLKDLEEKTEQKLRGLVKNDVNTLKDIASKGIIGLEAKCSKKRKGGSKAISDISDMTSETCIKI